MKQGPSYVTDEIHLWHVRLDQPLDTVVALHAMLSEDERDRAVRLRAPRLRERFIVGRAALRRVLGGLSDQHPADVAFAYSAAGKPVLAGPAHESLNFNLTHSQHLAI